MYGGGVWTSAGFGGAGAGVDNTGTGGLAGSRIIDAVTGALRAWSSGAGPMQFIKKLKKKEEATELGLRGGP